MRLDALLTIAVPGNEDIEVLAGDRLGLCPHSLGVTYDNTACAGWEYFCPEVMLQENEENFHDSPAVIDTFRS